MKILHDQRRPLSSQQTEDGISPPADPRLGVALLTGGQDRHYAFGLATALVAAGVPLDVIGSDAVDGPEMHSTLGLRFFNLYANRQRVGVTLKIKRILLSYVRLIRYAWRSEPRIFHILWNNRLELLDRTLLMLYFKLLGKKIVLTAHNVNVNSRDAKDSQLNRFTLKVQYRLADHIFVHTLRMKTELLQRYHVRAAAVTIIPYGVNNAVPVTELTSIGARERLDVHKHEKIILFFGAIRPYKGLEYLVAAFQQLAAGRNDYRLIIAGERKEGSERYLSGIQAMIEHDSSRDQITRFIEYIPDVEMELYFKAADVAVLPYTDIFQSGVLFLAYSFGLPVIATDVGSFAEDIIEGKTGLVCKPCDPEDLAIAIKNYFDSDLFKELDNRRQEIRDYAFSSHSWESVANMTCNVYRDLFHNSK